VSELKRNEYQQLGQMMRDSNVTGDDKRTVWAVMKEDGFIPAEATIQDIVKRRSVVNDAVRDEPLEFPVWGEADIEAGAFEQMRNAMRLPISVAGALMPDAHQGYGLPIGGVLATEDAVIPYAVGVDIACQVNLTVFDAPANLIDLQADWLKDILIRNTRFGAGCNWADRPADHAVLHLPDWDYAPLLRSLHSTAVDQLGTSGGGNHFVEWGEVLLPGYQYPRLGLMTHSGSRGVGFKIANYFSKLAESLHPTLPKELRHLSWLGVFSNPGQEYWWAMHLAGKFADACHEVIHQRIGSELGAEISFRVGNRHNFCWIEKVGYRHMYVHRKGATPAHKDVRGIIPGTMGDPAFIVRGTGSARSLNSASHGAGRRMGRREAIRNLTREAMDAYLQRDRVTLIGGDLDEAPMAYKSITRVMDDQSDLVKVDGTFIPRIVRMADDGSRED